MTKEEFKILRKSYNLTQYELAVILYVKPWTIQRYEQGLRKIPDFIAADLRDRSIMHQKILRNS